MDLKALKTHLKEICELHGPPGYEEPVRQAMAATWQPLVDSLEVGKLGSLVGIKLGSGPEPRRRIMLCAHMDEIGLIVKDIDRGFLKVGHMGGIDDRTLPGLAVIVHGRQPLKGVVGLPPLHMLSADQHGHYPKLSDLVIDVGLPADQVAELVSVGDVITMDTPIFDLQDRLAGKAIDDRACLAALTACLDALQSRKHVWDVLAVASVQEEVGSWGARTEAYRLAPDLAIALDVTFALQPGVSDGAYKLGGGGPPISLGANFHPALYDAINAAAERLEMTLEPDPLPDHSGTDAWPIQISRDGIPTALLNIPIRNMHSTIETVDMHDVQRTGRLLAEFIAGLGIDFLKTITWGEA